MLNRNKSKENLHATSQKKNDIPVFLRRAQLARKIAYVLLFFIAAAVALTILFNFAPWQSPFFSNDPLFATKDAQGTHLAAFAMSTADSAVVTDPQDFGQTPLLSPLETDVESSQTITPAPTLVPFTMLTALPTITPAPTAGAPQIQPTDPSATYHPQPGNPIYIRIDQESNGEQVCRDMLLAGQVFDLTGAPVQGLTISVEGELQGKSIQRTTETGKAPQYGPAGYEIKLTSQPIASANSLYVQVFSSTGMALSPKIPFDTFVSCEKNHIVINFVQG